MFLAKSAIPCKDLLFFESDAVERVTRFPFTYITAPAGYLLTGYLSSILMKEGHPVLWLRLGTEDRDPANFLLSLICTGQRFDQHLGEDTLNQMQRYPGCIYGWAPLFERLAGEFTCTLPGPCALVVEDLHQLGEAWSVLKLATSHFLNQLPPSVTRILTSHTVFPTGAIADSSNIIGVRDLMLRSADGLQANAHGDAQFTKEDLGRVMHLSQGRPEVLSGVLIASQQLGTRYVWKVLHQAKNQNQLLIQISRNCLQSASPEELLGLAFTSTLGYFQSKTFKDIFRMTPLPDGPWLQHLSNGWIRIREVWQPALETILHHYLSTQAGVLVQAAGLLADMGAVEIAVPLFLKIREYEQAARVIQANIDDLMNLGQWETLNTWLSQLPPEIILESPKTLYALGELQAFYGFLEKARNSFVHAGNVFSHRGDHSNACRSLLADSALASREGDEQHALLSAQNAHALSGDASMSQEQAWASWQLGMLASMTGKPAFAKIRFKDACQLTNDPYTRELFQQALTFAEELENAGLQHEYHHREAQLAEQTQRELFRRLLDLFKLPPDSLPDLLKLYGWLAVPLILKLPLQTSVNSAIPPDSFDKLVHQLKTKIRMILPWGRASSIPTTLSPLDLLAPIRPGSFENEMNVARISHSPARVVSEFRPVETTRGPSPRIMVYCMGPLRVMTNRQFVTNWPSHKAQLVFKYLLLHRNTPVHKETIMEAFWPEADVEAARRNLHQAIYNLRLTLKDIDDNLQIIEFEQDGYRINPAIDIWIDYAVFEQYYSTAQQNELAGFTDQAMAEYALAEEMYMDHLFSDDLYEDWVRSQREYLWQIYLAAATRLAEYHFRKKNFSSAISIGQRILQKDPCEETAHQILIRCFHSQGQRQLAIRQYEICRQSLRDELDVEPSNITKQFFSEILSD